MKFLSFFLLAAPLTLLALALSPQVQAEKPSRIFSSIATPELERGSRVISALDAHLGTADRRVTVREHAADDGLVSLTVEGGGEKVVADRLVYAVDRDEADVKSYGVTVRPEGNGFVVRSVKDADETGASAWANEYGVTRQGGRLLVSSFHYKFGYGASRGECSLRLLEGKALVNGETKSFAKVDTTLERAEGAQLIQLCQELGAN